MLRALLRTSVVCLPSQYWIITPQVHEPPTAPRNNPIGFDDPGSSASGSSDKAKNPVYSPAINTNLRKDGQTSRFTAERRPNVPIYSRRE
jgi:hypothetical protein